jgi:hypothetical protein
MYYTEHTLYLFWGGENRTRSSLMPSIRTFTRSRSPSPPSRSPSPSPEPYSYSRKPRQYISYDSLELLTDFEESLKNWREVSENYITNSLNISYNIPYKVLNIFIRDDSKLVFTPLKI